jgi:hypothetical protein
VAGERGVVGRRAVAQGGERPLVQAPPFAPQQLVLHGIGDERVGEPERVVGRLHRHSLGHEGTQRGEQAGVVELGDALEHLERGRVAEHGGIDLLRWSSANRPAVGARPPPATTAAGPT